MERLMVWMGMECRMKESVDNESSPPRGIPMRVFHAMT